MIEREVFLQNMARWLVWEPDQTDAYWLKVIAHEYGATDDEARQLLKEARATKP